MTLGVVQLPAGTGPLTITHGGDPDTTHTVKPAKGSKYTPRDQADLAALLAIDGAKHQLGDDPEPNPADPEGPALPEDPTPGQ